MQNQQLRQLNARYRDRLAAANQLVTSATHNLRLIEQEYQKELTQLRRSGANGHDEASQVAP
jgi:hypothetical protein